MSQEENLLFKHIQEYRRKFYLNQIIRGSLVLLLILSSVLFVSITTEGLLGLSSGVRTGLFVVISGLFLGILGRYVFWPAAKMTSLQKGMSDQEVAQLVRNHFPNVDDKLVNLLELRQDANGSSSELLMEAIRRRTQELAPISFSGAINLRMNLRYARYLLAPLGLFLLVGLVDPTIISDGTSRLVNFNVDYLPEAPFHINVENHHDRVVEGESFDLNAGITGNELPAELYVYIRKEGESDFINYPMERVRGDAFSFRFSEIKQNFAYYIGNEEVRSNDLAVQVLSRPAIGLFKVVVDYPGYTGLPNDTLADNVGDFKVLRGSDVRWVVEPRGQASEVRFMGERVGEFHMDDKAGKFVYGKRVMADEEYFLNLESDLGIHNIDTVRYRIDAVEDRYPSIYVSPRGSNFQADHTMEMPLDFEISDDYGFSKLSLMYRFKQSIDPARVSPEYKEVKLNISPRELFQHKEMVVNLLNLGMEEGDVVEYQIKVWDNDFVTGPKFSVSSLYTINYPSLDKKYDQVDENQEEILKELSEVQKELSEIKEEMEQLQEKTLHQRKLDYDDKKQLERLLQRQQNATEKMEEIREKMRENTEFLENNELISEETLEKYEKLNELMKELENEKLNEMMEKLQDKMEQIDPRELRDMMEEMKFDEEEMENNIERTMELMKQLQVQEKIEEIRTKMEQLEMKQEMLNQELEETDEKNKERMEELGKQQEKLQEKMEDIQKDLEELSEMKQETKTPDAEKMEELVEDSKEVQEQMDNAGEEMQKGDKKSGSQSQQNSQQKMEQMMEKLNGMQMDSQSQADQQNLESLRELLENLLRLSFKQEDLRDNVDGLLVNDPKLFDREVEQKQLFDDMMMVKDSLDVLAQKVFQIEKYVTDESNKIIQSMERSQRALDDKQIPVATQHQHSSMTSINNLANMLTDVMQQLQMQMKNQQPGSGQCNKPGAGNPSMQDISKQQGQLNQMMQQMMGQGQGKGMDPGKLAQMAAEQEKLRQALKEAHERIKQNGGSALGDMQSVMDMMKETEDELKNKQLSHETLMRQRKILNRLLDSFKAVREKEEFEDRRESQTNEGFEQSPPSDLDIEEYKNKIRQELLKSNQLEYSDDFIILIEKYFKLLENADER